MSRDTIPSLSFPTTPAPVSRPAEDEVDESYRSNVSTPTTSPTDSSRNSVVFPDVDDDAEEIVRELLPPCRIDGAHEVAMSFFGCVPPKNFGVVMRGVYRCAFPQKENLGFLRTLNLKTILTLVPEPYSPKHKDFVTENGINHVRIQIQANKDPFVVISQCDMAAALGVILDKSNHPVLIHCNKGKHRTGTTVGCLRKLMGWETERICNEYRHYAGVKARVLDERFMDMFDERGLLWLARIHGFVPTDSPLVESPIPSLSIVSTRLRG